MKLNTDYMFSNGSVGYGKTVTGSNIFETAFLEGDREQLRCNLLCAEQENRQLSKTLNQLEEEKKVAERNTAILFEVIVVNRNGNLVATDSKVRNLVVAADEQDAIFEANVDSALRSANLKPKEVTILCRNLGTIELEKPVQKVQLIKEAE